MSKGLGPEGPIRTCVGCSAKRNKRELIRLVLDEGNSVVLDPKGNKPGRGAYLCPSEECLEAALKKKRFQRAFRRQVKTEALAFDSPPQTNNGEKDGLN